MAFFLFPIESIINQRGIRRFGKKDNHDDPESSSASTASGDARDRPSSKNPRESKDDFNPGLRQRSATLVESGSGRRATAGGDLEQRPGGGMPTTTTPSFMDNFQMQMTRFEAEMNDRIVRLDLF